MAKVSKSAEDKAGEWSIGVTCAKCMSDVVLSFRDVSYVPPDEKPKGWWRRIFSRRCDYRRVRWTCPACGSVRTSMERWFREEFRLWVDLHLAIEEKRKRASQVSAGPYR